MSEHTGIRVTRHEWESYCYQGCKYEGDVYFNVEINEDDMYGKFDLCVMHARELYEKLGVALHDAGEEGL